MFTPAFLGAAVNQLLGSAGFVGEIDYGSAAQFDAFSSTQDNEGNWYISGQFDPNDPAYGDGSGNRGFVLKVNQDFTEVLEGIRTRIVSTTAFSQFYDIKYDLDTDSIFVIAKETTSSANNTFRPHLLKLDKNLNVIQQREINSFAGATPNNREILYFAIDSNYVHLGLSGFNNTAWTLAFDKVTTGIVSSASRRTTETNLQLRPVKIAVDTSLNEIYFQFQKWTGSVNTVGFYRQNIGGSSRTSQGMESNNSNFRPCGLDITPSNDRIISLNSVTNGAAVDVLSVALTTGPTYRSRISLIDYGFTSVNSSRVDVLCGPTSWYLVISVSSSSENDPVAVINFNYDNTFISGKLIYRNSTADEPTFNLRAQRPFFTADDTITMTLGSGSGGSVGYSKPAILQIPSDLTLLENGVFGSYSISDVKPTITSITNTVRNGPFNTNSVAIGNSSITPTTNLLNNLATDFIPEKLESKPENQLARTKRYTGTGGDINVVTGLDSVNRDSLTIIKNRDQTTAMAWFDTIRGPLNALASNNQNAEVNSPGTLTSFNSDGISLGDNVAVNIAGDTHVIWQFLVEQGFLDIVNFIGIAPTPQTVQHNLNGEVGHLIVKNLDTVGNWLTWARGFTGDQFLVLNGTNAVGSAAAAWNNTTPTTTDFTVGSDTAVNGNADNISAFVFAHNPPKGIFCGSYTGTGAAGNKLVTGFPVGIVIFKRLNSASGWEIQDNNRGAGLGFNLESPNAEASRREVVFENDGVTVTSDNFFPNGLNDEMIFIAIADFQQFTP